MTSWIKKFIGDQRGNFATMFALSLMPVVLGVGIAVDHSRMTSTRAKLQDAADSAALYAAIKFHEQNLEKFWRARVTGKQAFSENVESVEEIQVNNVQVILDKSQNTVKVTADGRLNPIFMGMFGYPKFNFEVESVVNLGSSIGAEIALVVDATNSMAFDDRWEKTMASVENVLEELEGYTGKDNLYVSLIPFHDRVKLGDAPSILKWYDGVMPANWEGCPQPREEKLGKFDWALTDEPPTGSDKFEYSVKTETKTHWGGLKCQSEITAPTNDIGEIIEDAEDLKNSGSGRFDVGLAWGWRMLSPKWQGYWGVNDYPAKNISERRKYIVLVTDGQSSLYQYEMSAETSPWGKNVANPTAYEHFADLCERIKQDDIVIYTLQIEGNTFATDYFKACATSEKHYIKVDNVEDVEVAFETIVDDYQGDLRLVR